MNPQRWQQIEHLYHAALEQAPESRADFLQAACPDDAELRQEVESLLASHDEAGSFIATPAADLAAGLFAARQSPTMTGRMLGRYLLRELIGSGGMGEVYRAKDARLGREVAVKLLPGHLSQDSGARHRFEREARAVAALSHPNILAIYDFGTDQDIYFAVTELLEGESLRTQFNRGKLPWKKAVELGITITDGLAAAHAKGIIHRDLKPENIFLTEKGQLKILDFGIARIKPVLLDDARTLTLNANHTDSTRPGMIMGTIGYMSPEQLRGEPVEPSSDLFSLGCLMFEALAGQRPFTRETDVDTIAAILREEPPSLLELVPEIPPALSEIIHQCLQKKPNDRPASASEVNLQFVQLHRQSKSARRSRSRAGQIERWGTVTGVSLLIGLLFLVLWNGRYAHPGLPPPETKTVRQLNLSQITHTGNVSCATVSPDGQFLVFGTIDNPTHGSLWIQQLATSTRRPILASSEIRYTSVTFTPDGNYVYFSATSKDRPHPTLYRTSVLGGPTTKILDHLEGRISFSPDGSHFVFRRNLNDARKSTLCMARADGQAERQVADLPFPDVFNFQVWSADGNTIFSSAGKSEGTANMYLLAINTADWSSQEISTSRWDWIGDLACDQASNRLLMIAQNTSTDQRRIWEFDPLTGTAQKITNDSLAWSRISLSKDAKTLIALQTQLVSNVWVGPTTDPQQSRQITFGIGGYRAGISWTPAGKLICDATIGNLPVVLTLNSDGSSPVSLTGESFGHEHVGSGTATPDGRFILFSADVTGSRHVWRLDTQGGNLTQLTSGSGEEYPCPTPDSQWVVFVKMETATTSPSIWKIPIMGGDPIQLISAPTSCPEVSPDGQKLLCLQNVGSKTDDWKLALYPITGGTPLKIFPQSVQVYPPHWTPDGRFVTYLENPPNNYSKIWRQPIDGASPEPWVQLEHDRLFAFAISPDGKQLACIRGLWANNAVLIQGF